jgi:cyclophilin family peptidyl-prolyl cis-trans isomerase
MNLFKTLVKPLLICGSFSALTLISACGGGGSDAGTPVVPSTSVVPEVAMAITHKVRVTTSKGVFELGLDATHAPITTANFLKYVNDGFYNSTVFHRVIKGFMSQGGGFVRSASGLTEKTGTAAAIKLESNVGLRNQRGTLAMARTSAPDSATAQFFINAVDNAFLNYQDPKAPDANGYAVFGKVTSGMDVVDLINAVATGSNDVPTVDITVSKVEVIAL